MLECSVRIRMYSIGLLYSIPTICFTLGDYRNEVVRILPIIFWRGCFVRVSLFLMYLWVHGRQMSREKGFDSSILKLILARANLEPAGLALFSRSWTSENRSKTPSVYVSSNSTQIWIFSSPKPNVLLVNTIQANKSRKGRQKTWYKNYVALMASGIRHLPNSSQLLVTRLVISLLRQVVASPPSNNLF
jgi:hypothetical protein